MRKLRLTFLKSKRLDLWRGIAGIVFRISFTTFLILLVAEWVEPGFVTNWFNPLWFLPFIILSVILFTVDE